MSLITTCPAAAKTMYVLPAHVLHTRHALVPLPVSVPHASLFSSVCASVCSFKNLRVQESACVGWCILPRLPAGVSLCTARRRAFESQKVVTERKGEGEGGRRVERES